MLNFAINVTWSHQWRHWLIHTKLRGGFQDFLETGVPGQDATWMVDCYWNHPQNEWFVVRENDWLKMDQSPSQMNFDMSSKFQFNHVFPFCLLPLHALPNFYQLFNFIENEWLKMDQPPGPMNFNMSSKFQFDREFEGHRFVSCKTVACYPC